MTKTAIVKGVARWYGKNVVSKLPPASPAKIGMASAVYAIETCPMQAETVISMALPTISGMFPGLISPQFADTIRMMLSFADTIEASGQNGDDFYNAFWAGLRKSVAEDQSITFTKPGEPMKNLNIRPSDIELIAGEIRTAQQELDNAAALAKANAPAPQEGAKV